MKKNINLKGIIVVLIVGVFSVCLVKQLTVLRRIKNDITIQTQELKELKEKNIRLQAELDRAQSNNEYLEKLARERLGLIKEGEQQIISNNSSE
ncbi:septum formation initiator family protein [Clostridium sp.]|uniref:FtsB family cell division protein n=1 Tax=Clostridium sp. TaxID=1506 RepID=UPI0025BA5E95|nr:septum formation initiator family protein [Clostridium sp.]MCI9069735.1 septum formation initiator family protein [Clostridium sp.]MCI9304685.1 septum formation initiator family protein [Clostridium sp.]